MYYEMCCICDLKYRQFNKTKLTVKTEADTSLNICNSANICLICRVFFQSWLSQIDRTSAARMGNIRDMSAFIPAIPTESEVDCQIEYEVVGSYFVLLNQCFAYEVINELFLRRSLKYISPLTHTAPASTRDVLFY